MPRIMNKLGWGVAGALGIALLASFAGVILAGPLDPPVGVTTSTSTQEVLIFQPSCPGGLPITLSAPGSYRLAQNITGCGGGADGIDITAAGVTLDLGGFSMTGVGGSNAAIRVFPGASNAVVRNGTVNGWGSFGVDIEAANGLIADLNVSSGGYMGIFVFGASASARISRCATTGNAATGIYVSDGAHAIVEGCESASNGNYGVATRLGSTITIVGSDVHDNAWSGIDLFGGTGSTVINNTVKSQGANGIVAGDAGSAITGNTVADNGNHGVNVTGDAVTIEGNTITQNHAQGIYSVGNRDRILNNHVSGNHTTIGCPDVWITGTGSGTVVENNSAETPMGCPLTGYGLYWFDAPRIIAHGNVARDIGGGAGYQVSPACVACDVGPIGSAAGSVSPWANISN